MLILKVLVHYNCYETEMIFCFNMLKPKQNDQYIVDNILNAFLSQTIFVLWFKFH